MYPVYEKKENDFEIYTREAEHIPPHLHTAMELVLVKSGSLEVGVGRELFHMEEGDIALVFPEMIHHYQSFDTTPGQVLFLHADATLVPAFSSVLQDKTILDPVIKAGSYPKEVFYILRQLEESESFEWAARHSRRRMQDEGGYRGILIQSYLQIILARLLAGLNLMERESVGASDIVYRLVEYIARNYTRPISLTSVAAELYVSPYALSRIFSQTFHMNFNRYLNQTRLLHFTHLIQYTDQSITEACLNSGFESQRTFNRVFQEAYHMSPSAYKKRQKV